ncbi:MAG: DNA/RNA non-specific endonuclease [Ferruginibacter sp.]
MAVCTIILYSCSKNTDDLTPPNPSASLPTLSTAATGSIGSASAVSGGTITSDGGAGVTARGVVWDINSNPTLATASKTIDGTGTGSFTSYITGLLPNTIYYVRAYATNQKGTAYGELRSFVTLPAPGIPGDNDPLNLGNPTNALASISFPENYLKDNGYYKLAYSQSRGTAVWVAWHLQSDDLGSTPRQDDFRPDTNLPPGWYQVQSYSYSGSGFDRGHNCPSADRTSTVAANSSTFLMTNMIPQAPTLNQGPWAGLESFIRGTLVGGNNEAYIVMGNFGQGGYNSSNTLFNTIDAGRVTVPSKVWKVILIIPKGNNDLARINSTAVVLAVDMPNDNRLFTTSGSNDWRNYITSVNSLEAEANASGVPLNLFQAIADTVRPILKAKLYP